MYFCRFVVRFVVCLRKGKLMGTFPHVITTNVFVVVIVVRKRGVNWWRKWNWNESVGCDTVI